MSDDRVSQIAEAVAKLADTVSGMAWQSDWDDDSQDAKEVRDSMRALAAGDAPEPDECPDCGGAALDFEPCQTCGVEEQPEKGGDAAQPERSCATCEFGPNTVDCGYFQGDHCSDPSGDDSRQYVTPGKHWQPRPADQPERTGGTCGNWRDCILQGHDDGGCAVRRVGVIQKDHVACDMWQPRPADSLAERLERWASEYGRNSGGKFFDQWALMEMSSEVRALQAARDDLGAVAERRKRKMQALANEVKLMADEVKLWADRHADLEAENARLSAIADERLTLTNSLLAEKLDLEARLAVAIEQRDRWNAASVEAHKRITDLESRNARAVVLPTFQWSDESEPWGRDEWVVFLRNCKGDVQQMDRGSEWCILRKADALGCLAASIEAAEPAGAGMEESDATR